MKKVLLTTTALVMTAGVAAAEISMSGTMGVAMVSSETATTGVTASTDKSVLVTGADLNFAASAAADNGLTAALTMDLGVGNLVDYNDDFAVDAQSYGDDANPAITMTYAGYTIVADNEGVDDLYDDIDANHKDISVAGAMGGIDFGIAVDTNDNKASYSLGMDLSGVAVTYTGSNESGANGGNKLALSYAMGDMTLTASSDDGGTAKSTNKAGVAYKMDAISVSYTLANTAEEGWKDYDVSVSYSAGAMSASYATDEEGVSSLVTTYDLGGGATFFASAKNDKDGKNVQQAAGINFKF